MDSTTTLAPIVVFAYNRPKHTRRLLDSLKQNAEFFQSPVTIYCDGRKKEETAAAVEETREVVQQQAPDHARIVLRDENFGLARSITTGVGENVKEYGKVIVAEDDLVFSTTALKFLNEALDRYANAPKAMHVSAYMYPTGHRLPEAFFYREATCWGWGTWQRAWQHFEPNAQHLLEEIDRRNLRFRYDIEGSMYFYQMLKKQAAGEIDSWAIRWYASILLNDGLSVHPAQSFVFNGGFDGSGVHCNVDDRFVVDIVDSVTRAWPNVVAEDESAVRAMIEYRAKSSSAKRNFWQRLQRMTHKLQRIRA